MLNKMKVSTVWGLSLFILSISDRELLDRTLYRNTLHTNKCYLMDHAPRCLSKEQVLALFGLIILSFQANARDDRTVPLTWDILKCLNERIRECQCPAVA